MLIKKSKQKLPTPTEYPERPADLSLWIKNGAVYGSDADATYKVRADTEVSIGRTNSKKALGFIVSRNGDWENRIDFVLNKNQVDELIAYLQFFLPRLKGRVKRSRRFSPLQMPRIISREE